MKLIQYTGPKHKNNKIILNTKQCYLCTRTDGKTETTLKISLKNAEKERREIVSEKHDSVHIRVLFLVVVFHENGERLESVRLVGEAGHEETVGVVDQMFELDLRAHHLPRCQQLHLFHPEQKTNVLSLKNEQTFCP
jgi:hypothetical protein